MYIAIAVLSLMLIGIGWMLCTKRVLGLNKSRPDNIAELLIALCGSQMLDDFAGLSRLGVRETDAIIKACGKEYSMGASIGVDGVERNGIDEDIFIKRVETKG